MPCNNPLLAWKVGGKITFNPPPGTVNILKPFNLPCNKCLGCRINYARSWALRCELEAKSHKDNCFITLTFSEENLLARDNPYSVEPSDFQKFMKRFRKKFPLKKVRFFHCGEYGEKTHRPHYHALIFGHDFRIPIKNNKVEKYGKKYPLYNSSHLNELWPFGFSTVGELNFETASYTARYVTKKIKGKVSKININPDTGEVSKINDIYCTMSTGRKPGDGIGAEYYHQYKDQIYGNDFIVNSNGVRMKPPRYYDKLFQIDNPDQFEAIKKARKQTLDVIGYSIRDPKYKRLREIEEVKQLKLKECLRELRELS